MNASLLFISPHLVAVASGTDTPKALRGLIRRALLAATLTRRILVLPQLPCDSAWIGNGSVTVTPSRRNISDPRVFIVGSYSAFKCYVGAHSYETCWPWEHVTFEFDPNVVERRPGALQTSWEKIVEQEGEAEKRVVRRDVELHHIPASLEVNQTDAHTAEVRKRCPDYFM